ncbi:hypothetical protein [Arthrobacter sp. Ld5]|uniref:hypothetical protein n=1 Tax=Arthrobacter sp. Ld5 TaxID=649152 RepID=UPI003EBF815D
MRQIELGDTAPSRLCPGPGHSPSAHRHCIGKHCVEVNDGLLRLWWAPDSRVTLADVLAAYEGIRRLSDGYVLPLAVYLQGMGGIAPAARMIILECSLTSRTAFVGTGPVDRVIAAFLEHARSETHYFENASEAEAWARGLSSGTRMSG